ncbi:DUF4114 domain-containing protein [filamentous cyanobacterium LEGE 11480]|uniref:DUF4114 domain-containing protein n=1 Tax=Romeriopsis navalis LEGE 11480 TaxID=2777977 RepID=A0A928VR80_9CYAN|nr:DUF4114 domain-containing protein [Romeriopsis navalis]MBE9031105.1 DUF4114 domain-containing protein [Romeriopsis navalis LEGE 11480]
MKPMRLSESLIDFFQSKDQLLQDIDPASDLAVLWIEQVYAALEIIANSQKYRLLVSEAQLEQLALSDLAEAQSADFIAIHGAEAASSYDEFVASWRAEFESLGMVAVDQFPADAQPVEFRDLFSIAYLVLLENIWHLVPLGALDGALDQLPTSLLPGGQPLGGSSAITSTSFVAAIAIAIALIAMNAVKTVENVSPVPVPNLFAKAEAAGSSDNSAGKATSGKLHESNERDAKLANAQSNKSNRSNAKAATGNSAKGSSGHAASEPTAVSPEPWELTTALTLLSGLSLAGYFTLANSLKVQDPRNALDRNTATNSRSSEVAPEISVAAVDALVAPTTVAASENGIEQGNAFSRFVRQAIATLAEEFSPNITIQGVLNVIPEFLFGAPARAADLPPAVLPEDLQIDGLNEPIVTAADDPSVDVQSIGSNNPNSPSDPDSPDDEPGSPAGSANPDNPNSPNQPVSPTGSANPDSPDDLGSPTDSSNPANPDSPNQPGSPMGPSNPVNPSFPNQSDSPSNPANPDSPNQPGSPTSPNQPGLPNQPGSPIPDSLDDAASPTGPSNPANPGSPNQPGSPTGPTNPVNPHSPTDSGSPTGPNQPDSPSNPANPGSPNQPGDGHSPTCPLPDQNPTIEPGTNHPLPTQPFPIDGTFTVGASGKVSFDFVFDGGDYTGQFGIFNLVGMNQYADDSTAFAQEAIRRSLSQSNLGYVVIDDVAEGANPQVDLGGAANFNHGEYLGAKTFQLEAGAQYGFMFVPNGAIDASSVNSLGDDAPLFSTPAAHHSDLFGQSLFASVTPNVITIEDIHQEYSDRDYNDMVVEIKGVTLHLTPIADVINPQRDWTQSTQLPSGRTSSQWSQPNPLQPQPLDTLGLPPVDGQYGINDPNRLF